MNKDSLPYKTLCTDFYELDKPEAAEKDLELYLKYAKESPGPLLEPMCGSGRFLIPLLDLGYSITGFDTSAHMLSHCYKKAEEKALKPHLFKANFETFIPKEKYGLIFIPSGSFSLLTKPNEATQALHLISK